MENINILFTCEGLQKNNMVLSLSHSTRLCGVDYSVLIHCIDIDQNILRTQKELSRSHSRRTLLQNVYV